MRRRSPRAHVVKTKSPRYRVPYYYRGKPRFLGLVSPPKNEFPLDDPVLAEKALEQMDRDWEGASQEEKELMVNALVDAVEQIDALLKSRLIEDPNKQYRLYQVYLKYNNGLEAFWLRLNRGL